MAGMESTACPGREMVVLREVTGNKKAGREVEMSRDTANNQPGIEIDEVIDRIMGGDVELNHDPEDNKLRGQAQSTLDGSVRTYSLFSMRTEESGKSAPREKRSRSRSGSWSWRLILYYQRVGMSMSDFMAELVAEEELL